MSENGSNVFSEYRELSAKFYQASKPVGFSIDGDIEYYQKELAGISGLVLEAGVSTGRVLIPLIKSGIKMEGLDSSSQMLKQCRLNLKKHKVEAVLYEQNLIDLALPKLYDAIIMPAGTFCLIERSKAQSVLQKFYEHLNESGKLIIDLEMPLDFKVGEINSSRVSISDTEEILLSSHSENFDWYSQKVCYTNKYELIKQGKTVQTEESDFVLYWYGVEEFRMILSLVGFKEISNRIAYGKAEAGVITFIAFR